MRLKCQVFVLLYFLAVAANAQEYQASLLNLGDPAPQLRVGEWLKGTPVSSFQKGRVYVIEFWATWCRGCIAALNHLSALATKYKNKVSVVGIDVYETKSISTNQLKAFVDSMTLWSEYHLATDDNNLMVAGWLEASGEKNNGIPRTFVVDAQGRLAWIGYPKQLEEVLPKIIDSTWDIEKVSARRKELQHLSWLDKEAYYNLAQYWGDPRTGDPGKPDSTLSLINKMVKSKPELRYAPYIAYSTFLALLKTDLPKAYNYGKEVIVTPTYEDPPYDRIYGLIDTYSDKLNRPDININKLPLSLKIYELGAEAYEAEIDNLPYPELVNISKLYFKMAEMYWCANNKVKAIDAMQKAIEALKNKKGVSTKELADFKSRLKQYKNI